MPQKRTRFIVRGGACAASKAASAAAENCSMAPRTVGNTPRTRSKRLMAKISATTGRRFATAILASHARNCFAAIIRIRRPTLLMYSTPAKSSTSTPFFAARFLHERRERRLELVRVVVIDAADGHGHDDVGELAARSFHDADAAQRESADCTATESAHGCAAAVHPDWSRPTAAGFRACCSRAALCAAHDRDARADRTSGHGMSLRIRGLSSEARTLRTPPGWTRRAGAGSRHPMRPCRVRRGSNQRRPRRTVSECPMQ